MHGYGITVARERSRGHETDRGSVQLCALFVICFPFPGFLDSGDYICGAGRQKKKK